MYSGDPEILIDRHTAFALCAIGKFVFAFDSYNVRGVLFEPPASARCLDLAEVFGVDAPTGARRTLLMFLETYGNFHVVVGNDVKVETIPLVRVHRLPPFIATIGALRYAFALIDHTYQFSYLLDATALAALHAEGGP